MLTEQIDRFHEDICKLDLYTDVIHSEVHSVASKTKFYSSEEYLQYQKQLLTCDLKAQILKHAENVLSKYAEHPQAHFQLAHRQKLKKFFALEFHQSVAETSGDRPPKIGAHDLVVCVFAGSKTPHNQHMIGVVDSVNEGLVIVKIMLKDVNELDERNFNLYNLLTKNSEWAILKVCSLENFNRSFVGFDSFQMCLLHKELLDLSHAGQASSGLFTQEALKCVTDSTQTAAVRFALKKRGVIAISGSLGTGKSALAISITKTLLNVKSAIKAEKDKAKQSLVAKVHTIDEILAMEDSDDDVKASSQVVFPWHQPGFVNVYDQNDKLVKSTNKGHEYERSTESDKHVNLKHTADDQVDPPCKILIVSPCSNAIDHLLDELEQLSKQFSIARVGQSLHRQDLNKRFSIDFQTTQPGGKPDPLAQQKVQEALTKAQIVLCGSFSLRQHAMDRTAEKFDTVIVDDANLVNETDCLSALRHGCQRAILIGNSDFDQSLFLLNPPAGNRTLFNRVTPSFTLSKQVLQQPVSKSKKKVVQPCLKKVFIDVSFGKESAKKESYENKAEADAIADYLVAYGTSIDPKKLAVMSPFRTQALVIKSVLQDERKDDLPKPLRTFGVIGSFEDFVSCHFDTVIVSLCKTEPDAVMQKPMLNSHTVFEFVKSLVTEGGTLIVVGKSENVPDVWREQVLKDKATQVLEI